MVSVAAQRFTAYSIIREIGNEVLRNRILPELEEDFTSHEFIKKLVFLFREEYQRMQDAHADCGDSAVLYVLESADVCAHCYAADTDDAYSYFLVFHNDYLSCISLRF